MTILVTGATGNIGRMVVDHLLAGGAPSVRALTTDPERAALPDGVQVARGYLRRPDTLPAALAGVDRMYLAPTPDTVTDVLALARDAGVAHVVDLSGEPSTWWGAVTAAVEDSGLAWTHLWPGDFMENTWSWAPQIAASRTVREPHPDGRSAPIAMDDIARVAASVLLSGGLPAGGLLSGGLPAGGLPAGGLTAGGLTAGGLPAGGLPAGGHAGRALSLTGPEVLTRVELASRIGDAIGAPVEFVTVPRDEAVAGLAAEMGEDAAWYVDTILAGNVGNPVEANTLVEDVTGRPATTFAQWAREHAAVFRG
ncbi:NAD(P)H-binding protein [Pseudonocardia saturnea]